MSIVRCGIVGDANSGKTALVTALLATLSADDLRVGYLKHAHAGADIDRPGSDSDRAFTAGATEVAVADPTQVVRRRPACHELDVLVAGFTDCDVVLIEGFSAASHPKIRVSTAGQPPREVADPVVLDLVGDGTAWTPEAVAQAAAVVRALVSDAGDVPGVTVVADGTPVAMHRFASQIVAGTLLGTASALKGVEDPRTLTVSVRQRPPAD